MDSEPNRKFHQERTLESQSSVAREEQVQAVGHAGSEGDGVAEGVLRIEVEGQTLGRDDADDEQHADDHGGDAQDALDVELFLQEDRCQDG